jgi:hypothetical protein
MHMIRHQAIREDIHPVLFRVFTEQVEIHPPVFVGEEHVVTSVSPLRDVVRYLWHNDPGCSWHTGRLHPRRANVKPNMGSVPLF